MYFHEPLSQQDSSADRFALASAGVVPAFFVLGAKGG